MNGIKKCINGIYVNVNWR